MSKKVKKPRGSGALRMSPSQWRFLLLFAVPTFLLYLYICIWPMISAVANSIYEWNGYGPRTFVGLGNYVTIFKDAEFWEAFLNDLVIVLWKEVIIVALAVLFAVSLTQAKLTKKEVTFFRFLFYVPNILSVILISMVWKYFFESIDTLLHTGNGLWTDHPLPLIIFIASWAGVGYYMIVLISAINNIPKDVYEAASVDGATQLQQMMRITIPEILPQIRYIIVNVLAGSLAVNMNLILPLTGGQNHTMVMGLYVYNYGTGQLNMVGYAYAAAVVLMAISFVLCLAVNLYLKRKEDQ